MWKRLVSNAALVAAACGVVLMMASAQAATEESPMTCLASQYLNGTDCANFTSPLQKASKDFSQEIDPGNTAWMLISSALVMVMTPGLAFFYAGLVGEELASNTIMMSFISMAVVSIQFFVCGYSIGFSGNGLFEWFGFRNVGQTPSGLYGSGISNLLFAFFQMQFATITPALISGGVVGRIKFGSYILFVLLWSTFVYDPLARWMWAMRIDEHYLLKAAGWEGRLGGIDFAGGTVIEVASGFSTLVAALMVGKRYNHDEPHRPHNVPLVMIGLAFLWFGWFGFNAGSAGAANGIAVTAAVNTHLAACAGFLVWLGLQWAVDRVLDPCGAAGGAVAGMVAITPSCGFVEPWASLLFGVAGGAVGFGFVTLKNRLRYDDTLDVFAVHGMCGYVGGIMLGLFASPNVNAAGKGWFYGGWDLFWHHVVCYSFAAAYSAGGTFVILLVLKYTVGLRVSDEKERAGMDLPYHGGRAYQFTEGSAAAEATSSEQSKGTGTFVEMVDSQAARL